VAISLTVAAVPDELPAIVTIALAIGVQHMAARHAQIRKLPAVETLGRATVICTDKTGTLTTGVMTVRELWAPTTSTSSEPPLVAPTPSFTGIAILAAAAERGVRKDTMERSNPRGAVNPCDSERKPIPFPVPVYGSSGGVHAFPEFFGDFEWARRDSNSLPPAPEAGALSR
jgi:Ca2+-transporting ATPase